MTSWTTTRTSASGIKLNMNGKILLLLHKYDNIYSSQGCMRQHEDKNFSFVSISFSNGTIPVCVTRSPWTSISHLHFAK